MEIKLIISLVLAELTDGMKVGLTRRCRTSSKSTSDMYGCVRSCVRVDSRDDGFTDNILTLTTIHHHQSIQCESNPP